MGVLLTIAIMPLLKVFAIGVAAHVAENRLALAGHGDKVVYVKLATYVLCLGVAVLEWKELFITAGAYFDLNTGL